MLGICSTWHHFGQDEDGFQLNLVEFFFSGIFSRGSTPVHWLVQGKSRTLSILRHCLWNAHEEVLTRRRNLLVPSESNSSNGTDVESENDTQTESGCTRGRRRRGGRPCGQVRTTQRGQSVDGGRQRGVRGIRSGGVESRVSAGGGSTWRGRGRGLSKRTREGRIGVVEEDTEQRQARVPGRYLTSIWV